MPMQSAEQQAIRRDLIAQVGPHGSVKYPVVHGARSRRIVDPLAQELADAVVADRPDLGAYPEAVAAWARAEAQLILYQRWHAEVGMLDEKGSVRGGVHYFAAESNAVRLRKQLGLDPLSEAQLRKLQAETAHVVADIPAVRARGAEALAHREDTIRAAIDTYTAETVTP